MSYFPDLSLYTYMGGDPSPDREVVNVGWLDHAYPFEKGSAASDVCERLKEICLLDTARKTRGFHLCQFCPLPSSYWPPLLLVGREKGLGSAEIRVKGAGKRVYACPDLIYHCVTEHSYRPPVEFLEAVRSTIK